MRPRLHHLLLLPVIAAMAFVPHAPRPERAEADERDAPSDYFYHQRAMAAAIRSLGMVPSAIARCR